MQYRYDKVTVVLHWAIGVTMIALLACGFFLDDIPKQLKPLAYGLHKSFGMTVFFLGLVHLGWRISRKAPPLPGDVPGWVPFASRISHGLLAILMILMPFTGWGMVSASPTVRPLAIFGISFPFLPLERSRELASQFHSLHETVAWVLFALLLIHVAAVLYHAYVRKDSVLDRILLRNRD